MVSVSRMLSAYATTPTAKTIVSTAASVAATAMLVRSMSCDLLPPEIRSYVVSSLRNLFRTFSSEVILIIHRKNGLSHCQIYKAAKIYLGTKISPHTNKFVVSMDSKESRISTSMAKNEEPIVDYYNGVAFKWRQITRTVTQSEVISYFELRFHKKHKEMVLEEYLPHILNESKSMTLEMKTLRICTLKAKGDPYMRRHSDENPWSSMKLDHPATFATLAMDAEMKKTIMDDLDMFVRRKDFYRKVGKAWKRGYLLYGPPGTGKSSLIAAMANHLNFDVYDLELAGISSNAELRKLLIKTGNRSILVVEDIDCSLSNMDDDRKKKEEEDRALKSSKSKTQTVNIVQKEQKSNQVTLSGLLNLTDGLWSSCGDERIIVFTTNHKDRLEAALLRPGRMDMHIHMSYCSPCAFRALAGNYHGINDEDYRSLFEEIDGLLVVAMVTPAEVGEQLLRSENVDVALTGLIHFLKEKIRETNDAQEELESEENGEE